MMLRVEDNAISEELFDEVRQSATFFPEEMTDHDNIGQYLNGYHEEQCDCYAPYMFWDGWVNSPANTLKKRVIQEIWSRPGLLPFDEKNICGFEYWTRTFSEGQYLAPHVDEDTFLYAKSQMFHGPSIGCVWYGPSESTGGFLELHDSIVEEGHNALERDNIDPLLSPIDFRERIAYKPNRLVVFDAGHRLHEATKVLSGKRNVMVINVWHIDSPPSAITTGEFFSE